MRFDEQAVSEDIAPFSSPEEMTSAAQQPSVAWPSEESLRHALPFQNATISGIEEEEDGDDNSERLGGGFSSVLLDDDDEENDDANDYDENGNHALPVSAPGEGEGTEEDPSEGVWP